MKIPLPFFVGLLAAASLRFFSANALAQGHPDCVVIVLDASGSMKGPMPGSRMDKMTAAKAALKEVLKHVPPSTHIGLLVFSSKNIRNHWVYPLGPRKDTELMKAIDLPQADGGTPLGQYIKLGADRLLQERAKNYGYGSYRLLVVTDGEANDPELVERYTPEVIARGITTDVIGVAMRQDHTLATKVHSYRRANDPGALRRALAEVFAEVSQTATDVAQAEAFELIAPLPNEVAAAVVHSLAHTGNQPIGEKPRPVQASSAASPPAETSTQAAPAAAAGPTAPGQPASSAPQRRLIGAWPIILIGAVVVVALIFRKLK